MNNVEIDKLKSLFSHLIRSNVTFRSIDYGIEGKMISIGYSPYWTTSNDSKIEKLEMDFLSSNGRLVPLVLNNIVTYELYPQDAKKNQKYRVNIIELYVISPYLMKRDEKDMFDKVRLEIIYDDE